MSNEKIKEMVKGFDVKDKVLDEKRMMLSFKNDEYSSRLDEEVYKRFAAYLTIDAQSVPENCCITFMAGVNSGCDLLDVPHVYKASSIKVKDEETGVEKTEVKLDTDKVFFPKFTKLDENGNKKEEEKVDPAEAESPKDDIDDSETDIPLEETAANSEPAIRFDYDKMIINTSDDQPENKDTKEMYKDEIDDIDLIVKSCIPEGLGYNYNVLDCGLIDLVLFNKADGRYLGSFQIDPNNIHGNGYYINSQTPWGGIMAPLDNFELVKKVLSGDGAGGNYILTEDEMKSSMDKLFDNPNVYLSVDMSGHGNTFKTMPKEDYKEFGRTLDKILTAYQMNLGNVPRFRISSFTDIDNFELVSDNKCKMVLSTQIPFTNSTSIVYNEGKAMVKFSNGSVYGMLIE